MKIRYSMWKERIDAWTRARFHIKNVSRNGSFAAFDTRSRTHVHTLTVITIKELISWKESCREHIEMTHTHKCLKRFFTNALNATFAHTLYPFSQQKTTKDETHWNEKTEQTLCTASISVRSNFSNISVGENFFCILIHRWFFAPFFSGWMSECICVLVLPIKILNRNGDKTNSEDDGGGDVKRSQWEIVCNIQWDLVYPALNQPAPQLSVFDFFALKTL